MSNKYLKVKTKYEGINTLLNIHQSIKLRQSVSTQRNILQENQQQTAQLKAVNETLQSQLQMQTAITQQREFQKQLKSILFNQSKIIDKINSIDNDLYKKFFVNLYCNDISETVESAIGQLEDIPDKEYGLNILKKNEALISNQKDIPKEYNNSDFKKLEDAILDYNAIQLAVDNKLREDASIQTNVTMYLTLFFVSALILIVSLVDIIFIKSWLYYLLLPGLLFTPFFYILYNYDKKKRETKYEAKKKILNLTTEYNLERDNHPLHQIIDKITKDKRDFEILLNEFAIIA